MNAITFIKDVHKNYYRLGFSFKLSVKLAREYL